MDGLPLDPISLDAQAPRPEAGPGGVPRRFVRLPEGRSLAYAEAGDGPAVVLIHGTLMTLEDVWLPLAPHLLPRSRRVIALDRPGHGLSVRRRLVDASPWRQAALIRAGLDAIGVARPVLMGHSFGATVALCHALAYPAATAGVVALAPQCFPEPRIEQALFGARFVPGLGDLLAHAMAAALDPVLLPLLWRAIFLPQAMPADFVRHFPVRHAAGPERMVAQGEDAMSLWPALARAALAYPTCPVPVRIFGGTVDAVVNNATNGRLAALMMPEARFSWLPGYGHMPHHFQQDRIAGEVAALARPA